MGERLAELLGALRNLERGYDRRFAASFKSDDIFDLLPALVASVEHDAAHAEQGAVCGFQERALAAEAELARLRYAVGMLARYCRALDEPPPGGGAPVV